MFVAVAITDVAIRCATTGVVLYYGRAIHRALREQIDLRHEELAAEHRALVRPFDLDEERRRRYEERRLG